MSDNPVRSAIGEALDHPFAEEAFALVDVIEANVRDGEPGGELHEVASEITDAILAVLNVRAVATLWAVLSADGAADEEFGETQGSTYERIYADLWVVVERAVFAGLEAYSGETSTCRHCGRSVVRDGEHWVDPEATGDDSIWRETCDAHDTFVAEHEITEEGN